MRQGFDRIRHGWRVLNSDEWRYSTRGLIGNWIMSFVLVGLVLALVSHHAGSAILTALSLATMQLLLGWWRKNHRPPPRPKADPAWYPDPSGKHDHRYWDGDRWTDRVLDGSVQSIDW